MSDDITTVYGKVNRARLEELQQSFDTTKLPAAVEFVDQMRKRICDPEGLRRDLLKLHEMAMELINQEPAEVSEREVEADIWAEANDLEMEVYDYAEKLHEIVNLLEDLATLTPHDL
jgi:hypothetical protein